MNLMYARETSNYICISSVHCSRPINRLRKEFRSSDFKLWGYINILVKPHLKILVKDFNYIRRIFCLLVSKKVPFHLWEKEFHLNTIYLCVNCSVVYYCMCVYNQFLIMNDPCSLSSCWSILFDVSFIYPTNVIGLGTNSGLGVVRDTLYCRPEEHKIKMIESSRSSNRRKNWGWKNHNNFTLLK